MGLLDTPPTRPRTYVDGTPVDPNDMNESFDAQIALKHGVIEFGLHAVAWIGQGATFNGTLWSPPAGGGTLYAALAHVGVGSTITQVKFGYNRANAGQISYQLIRKPIGGAAAEVIATANDTVSNGFVTQVLAALNHLVAADYGYAVEVIFDNAAAAAGSVLIGGSCFHMR